MSELRWERAHWGDLESWKGFDGALLVAQVIESPNDPARSWRAYLSHQPVNAPTQRMRVAAMEVAGAAYAAALAERPGSGAPW